MRSCARSSDTRHVEYPSVGAGEEGIHAAGVVTCQRADFPTEPFHMVRRTFSRSHVSRPRNPVLQQPRIFRPHHGERVSGVPAANRGGDGSRGGDLRLCDCFRADRLANHLSGQLPVGIMMPGRATSSVPPRSTTRRVPSAAMAALRRSSAESKSCAYSRPFSFFHRQRS